MQSENERFLFSTFAKIPPLFKEGVRGRSFKIVRNTFLFNLLFIFSILTSIIMLSSCNKTTRENSPVLLPVPADPTISFKIWFKVGSQNDPKGKEGLAALTATLMTDGATKNNTYDVILEKLFPMAASYTATVDKEMTVISGRTHKDNLEEYYKLFTDAILQPAFNSDDFNRIKSDMLNYIEKEIRYSSDEELGKATLYNFIFDGTPYGHMTVGTVESLKSITLNDIKQFYKKYFTKDNYVIGIGGGYDSHLVNRMETDLAQLPEGKPESIAKPEPKKIDGLNFEIVDKDCDATAISFGFPISLVRSDSDFAALALFNSWFGEHRNSSSHLYHVLREKRGLNYGDYSYIETFLNGGEHEVPKPNNPRRQQIFEVWLRPVQNANRHFALRTAMRELQNVVDHGLTQEQFDLTKKYLMNYCLFYAQTTSEKLGYEIDSRFYGVNDNGNYIEYFRNNLNKLTLADVNNAIKKYIQYKNIKIAVITKDAESFKKDLVNDTPSPITYVSPMPSAVLDEDKIIEKYPLPVSADKIKIIKVEDMFQR